MMRAKGFQYAFTAKELAYFLFSRRSCPDCGGRMDRRRAFSTETSNDLFDIDGLFASSAEVKAYYYVYACPSCHRRYTLSELVNRTEEKSP